MTELLICGQVNDVGGSPVSLGTLKIAGENPTPLELGQAAQIAWTANTTPELTNAWVEWEDRSGQRWTKAV